MQIWLKQNNIDFFLKAGVADQTLCFNPTVTADLIALLNYCKQQRDQSIYLTEALIDQEENIIDENGKKYCAEFVISYHHSKQIYQPIQTKELIVLNPNAVEVQFAPGSEWLYAEIFVHPSKSNLVLRREIEQLLKAHKNQIVEWFFIRYDENGKHLRLRLRLKDADADLQTILKHLNKLLAPLTTNGIVTEVVFKTYVREVARYGASRIALVEQFFHFDSKAVLSLLCKEHSKSYLYHHTLKFIAHLTQICFPEAINRLQFIKQMSEVFASEFNLTQEGFKKINQSYATLKKSKQVLLNPQERCFKSLENQAQAIFMLCEDSEKSKMLADLIHMHINRVFSNHQRLHEAICYQFFYKQLLNELGREAAEAERQFSA